MLNSLRAGQSIAGDVLQLDVLVCANKIRGNDFLLTLAKRLCRVQPSVFQFQQGCCVALPAVTGPTRTALMKVKETKVENNIFENWCCQTMSYALSFYTSPRDKHHKYQNALVTMMQAAIKPPNFSHKEYAHDSIPTPQQGQESPAFHMPPINPKVVSPQSVFEPF